MKTFKVLLVEDDGPWQKILRADIQDALSGIDWVSAYIRSAATFDEGWEALQEENTWNLLVTDIGFPSEQEMFGKALVERSHRLQIPTIVISAIATSDDVRNFLRVNKIYDFFSKRLYYTRTHHFIEAIQEIAQAFNEEMEPRFETLTDNYHPSIGSDDSSVILNENNRDLSQPNEKKLEKRVSSFNWLHLTDLHYGMKEQAWLWPGVREIFWEDLKRLHDKCGPWDLVLFTGDLTQRGGQEEFQQVDELIQKLWSHLNDLGSRPELLVVPGNHDLVRPNQEEPAVILLQQWLDQPTIQSKFWDDKDSPYRQAVTEAFRPYITWWERQPFKPNGLRTGMLPGDFSVTIANRQGAQLGIVGLNTSFLQLTGGNYQGKLALHARQFHAVCDGDGPAWARKNHACMLLTHHPPMWLSPQSQKDLSANITARGRFAIHLCGHMHEAAYRILSEAGTESRRLWQGRSLFGLEYFSKDKEDVQRLHGYTAGKIELNGGQGKLMLWPREARLQGGQWDIVPDYSLSLTDDQHNHPTMFKLLKPYVNLEAG